MTSCPRAPPGRCRRSGTQARQDGGSSGQRCLLDIVRVVSWSAENQFYELEIWRSESEAIDPLNQTKLATITDYNKNNFEDYYLIGDGVSWFYKINLIDIYGNSNTSNMIIGNSHP